MVKRYNKDYRGDYFEHPTGYIVMYTDHLEEVNKLKDRIIELIGSVHGEFCAESMKTCGCGAEIKELRDNG